MNPDVRSQRVLLTSAGPPNDGWEDHPRQLLRRSALESGLGDTLVEDPAAATLIIICTVAYGGMWMRLLLRHPWSRAYPEKVFVYSEADHPWPRIRGIYASVPRDLHDSERHRGGPYLPFHHSFGLGAAIQDIPDLDRPMWLWSFVGAVASAPRLRREVITLDDERAYLIDTSAQRWSPFYGAIAQRAPVFARYLGALRDSSFVVCPRGSGSSSMRLFEAMSAGRVPVIISDAWVAPEGPRWSDFSIRVLERDVAVLPALLREYECAASAMGAAAREAYNEWFAPPVLYRHTVETCATIAQQRRETVLRRHMWSLKSLAKHTTWRHLWAEWRDPIRPDESRPE